MGSADRIQIRLTDDGLEAWISVSEGETLDRGALEAKLDAARVCAGLDEEVISGVVRALALEAAMLQERCVARGVAARPGSPPVLHLNDPSGPVPGVLDEEGRLDFRERLFILPVVEGDAIGHIEPGRAGEPGCNVHGDPIPPPPIPELDIKHGEGISIDDEGMLIATRTGARTIDPDGSIDVVNLHVHPGHVDLTSGNLRTEGSLEVARDVSTGMSVHAGVDVKIGGAVDGGRIFAGGSIEIVGGVFGREAGRVVAGGDLRVRHALGAELRARGRLAVARSVSTSTLIAKEIEIGGKLLSNLAQAETRLVLQDAGSPAGGPCVLRAAHPLEPGEASSTRSGGVRVGDHIQTGPPPISSLRARKKRSCRGHPGGRAARLEQLAVIARRDFRRRQRKLQRVAVIEIQGIAHAGCRLDFGVAPLVLDRDIRAKSFHVDPDSQTIVETGL